MHHLTPQAIIEAELRKRAAAENAAAAEEEARLERGRLWQIERDKQLPGITRKIRAMAVDTAATMIKHRAEPNAALYLPETQRISVRRPGLLGNLGCKMKETVPSDETMPVWIIKHIASQYEYPDGWGQERWTSKSYHHSGFALTRDGEIVTYTAPDYGDSKLPDHVRVTMQHTTTDTELTQQPYLLTREALEWTDDAEIRAWKTVLTETALKNIPSGNSE